jgi:hypothetical protein
MEQTVPRRARLDVRGKIGHKASLSTLYQLEPASFTEQPEEWGYKKLAEKFANKCLDQVKTAALAHDVRRVLSHGNGGLGTRAESNARNTPDPSTAGPARAKIEARAKRTRNPTQIAAYL